MKFLFGFRGRFNRLEWWGVQALVILGYVLLITFIGQSIGVGFFDVNSAVDEGNVEALGGGMLALLLAYFILTYWVVLASCVKRYHDRDKSGWWYLIILVPLIGPIWQFVELGFLGGTDGSNDFEDFERANAKPALQTGGRAYFVEAAAPTSRPSLARSGLNGKPSFGKRNY